MIIFFPPSHLTQLAGGERKGDSCYLTVQNSINTLKIPGKKGKKKPKTQQQQKPQKQNNKKTSKVTFFEDLLANTYWKMLQAPPFSYLASNLSFANTCITKMP